MNSIKALFATLGIAAAISPALASTDGLPPNLQDQGVSQSTRIEGMTARSTPQFLHGQGEVSLVPNPAFNATPAAAPVRMGRVTPIRNYVGA